MRWRLLWLAVLVTGCHDPPASSIPPVTSAVVPPSPTPAPAPSKRGLAGEVIAPDGAQATGRLAITWRTHDEERDVAGGNLTLTTIRHMLDRMTVSSADIDLGKTPRIPYSRPRRATPCRSRSSMSAIPFGRPSRAAAKASSRAARRGVAR